MRALPIRLHPGDDLRLALASRLPGDAGSALVLGGIGSLSVAAIRFAGVDEATRLVGALELLTLGGTLSRDGARLHATVADAGGQVHGGHVAPGCTVRTTAEVLLAVLDDRTLAQRFDAATGCSELAIEPLLGDGGR